MASVYALIMAGGSGTRFWPASRKHRPKQLLPLGAAGGRSLIASTVERSALLCPREHIRIATAEHLVEATRGELPDLRPEAFFGEPYPRNTAACIGWGAALISRADPEALVMALPSDHSISDEQAYVDVARRALESAERGVITTLGITPARPETGYGYIEAGEEAGGGIRRVVRFVEKPDRATAEEYVASGRYFWNSGMFFFRARDMLDAIVRHMPELGAGLTRIEAAASRGASAETEETRRVFESLPSVSIDYGVMEKVSPLHVVPAECAWNDVGSWQAVYELAKKGAEGNVAGPDALLLDARGNLVQDLRRDGRRRVVALVGVDDLCVIETDDALLVIPRERAQEVRRVVDELGRRGRGECL